MNVLCLGSEVVGAELAADLVRIFLGATLRRRRTLRATTPEDRRSGKEDLCLTHHSHRLSALGQSVWIDYLSRDLLHSGRLAQMMDEDAVTGVTSNPTIFQKAISQGTAYDDQMRDLLEHEDDPKEIFVALAGRDIGEGCDLMRKVWDEGKGLRGYVSMEVDPTLADDTDGTIAEARRFHALIDKPNLYVKIPATKEGLPAIEEMIAAGKSINVTLIFSLRATPRGDGGVHPRDRAAGRGRRRPAPGSHRWRASSSRGSTPRRTSGSTRSAATTT